MFIVYENVRLDINEAKRLAVNLLKAAEIAEKEMQA